MPGVGAAPLLARGVRAAMLPLAPRGVDARRLVAIAPVVVAVVAPPRPAGAPGDAAASPGLTTSVGAPPMPGQVWTVPGPVSCARGA